MSESHWRMELNNYLQANGGARQLRWEVVSYGPPHQVTWQAVAFINGVEYARAMGSRQNVTMEEAARQTLSILYNNGPRYY
ncbi:hypothetical protein C8Q75DRAFT_806079 [Abortiporus biennis]|nr:hypothetical protein C8Q75DRAFT_806079 [Abortiporus biennis]